jgi:hypothetical protein
MKRSITREFSGIIAFESIDFMRDLASKEFKVDKSEVAIETEQIAKTNAIIVTASVQVTIFDFLGELIFGEKQRAKIIGLTVFLFASLFVCVTNQYSILWSLIPFLILLIVIIKGAWNNYNFREF